MLRYIIKRLVILIPVVILISIVIFSISKMMPGDPVRAMLPLNLRPELYQAAYDTMYARLGLDKSLPEQYVRFMYNIIVNGDLGFSTMERKPVVDAIETPLLNTILLNVIVNFCYLAIALPVGIRMAVKRNSLYDRSWQVFSLVMYSVPSFFLGLSLIYIFGIKLGWLPLGGLPNRTLTGEGWPYIYQWMRHLVLPVTTLTLISLAGTLRYVRNAVIDALSQDYIRTARSKGLSEKVVIYSHAFRNALIPVSTVIVFTLFALFGGAIMTESIFQYNGMGRLMYRAVMGRDNSMIVSMNLFFAVVNVTAVLAADIVYGIIDPRIKLK